MLGGRAAAEAVQCMADLGLDLGDHETQPLTEPLVRHADVIYAMTRSHREAIVAQWPSRRRADALLSADGADIWRSDRRAAGRYRHCAAQIEAELNTQVNELEICDHANCHRHRSSWFRRASEDRRPGPRWAMRRSTWAPFRPIRSTIPTSPPTWPGKVSRGEVERGILVCGTGLGMCIAANKVRGVRAAPCHDDITAEMSRRHNDANVLCLSADLLGERLIDRMIEIWLSTPFEGGRHARRVDKIMELETQA